LKLTIRALAVIGLALLAVPCAFAHHGKDFLMTETDDMPAAGHVYGLLSSDTNIDKDGGRTTEITPGLLFAVGPHIAVEPHFHVSRAENGDDDAAKKWHYDATALAVRYSAGTIPGSEWRFAVSGEVEKPKDSEEHSEGTARLIFVRTFPNSLVAINLLAGRELARDGEKSYGLGLGILTPLANGDNAGIELSARLPTKDGYEVLPGYYHKMSDTTTVKIGVGVFHSQFTSAGTLHVQLIGRF
jgi:hypothetical protein